LYQKLLSRFTQIGKEREMVPHAYASASAAHVRLLSALAVNCLLGCGDSQVPASYRGDPIYQLGGDVQPGAAGWAGAANIRVAFFYSPNGLNVTDPTQMVEHLGSALAVTVPSSFMINVFDAPGPELLLRNPDGTDAGYGVARLLVYQDSNQDGQYTAGESFVGGDVHNGYFYVPQALPASRTPTSGPLPAGFSAVLLPQLCGFVPPPPTQPGDCGVSLGDVCAADNNCMGGSCLQQTSQPWPGGYCVILDPPTNSCRPGAAAYLGASGMGGPKANGYYLRPCQQDSDCIRMMDPSQNIYHCDVGLLGCTPASFGAPPMIVGSTNSLSIPAFCVM
jgi:hypothetical protein